MDKLLKVFDRSYFPEHRDFMLIMLILDTGMRIGECLQAAVDDLDMDEGTICLSAENPNYREGRPKKFTENQLDHAMELLNSGKSYKQVEAMTEISKSTLIRTRRA